MSTESLVARLETALTALKSGMETLKSTVGTIMAENARLSTENDRWRATMPNEPRRIVCCRPILGRSASATRIRTRRASERSHEGKADRCGYRAGSDSGDLLVHRWRTHSVVKEETFRKCAESITAMTSGR